MLSNRKVAQIRLEKIWFDQTVREKTLGHIKVEKKKIEATRAWSVSVVQWDSSYDWSISSFKSLHAEESVLSL